MQQHQASLASALIVCTAFWPYSLFCIGEKINSIDLLPRCEKKNVTHSKNNINATSEAVSGAGGGCAEVML